MKESLLDTILSIRREIGASYRVPAITGVRHEEKTLIIECEDRADKSIVIGTGGGVVGRLATRLGYESITVESHLDAILKEMRQAQSLELAVSLGASSFSDFLSAWAAGDKPPGINVAVAGEEYMWACGFFEDSDSRPVMLHTCHMDERVKEAYPKTEFVQIDIQDQTPRKEALQRFGVDFCCDSGIGAVVGPFNAIIDMDRGIAVSDLRRCLGITMWQSKRYEKKRFFPHPYIHTLADRTSHIARMLKDVFEGTAEPNDCAGEIARHWSKDIDPSKMGVSAMMDTVRKYRAINALRRAENVSSSIYDALVAAGGTGHGGQSGMKALVAWSGGTDSSACISLSKKMGFETDCACVAMPHIDMDMLRNTADELGCRFCALEMPDEHAEVVKKVEQGRIHPCGQCHALIERCVTEHARACGYDILIYGDMISCGAQSIVDEGDIILLNLPAALGLSKKDLHDTISTSPGYSFGCPLLKKSHNECKGARRVSIQRVLRELRSQALDEKYAFNMISDIMTTHTISKQLYRKDV